MQRSRPLSVGLDRRAFLGGAICGGMCLAGRHARAEDDTLDLSVISNCTERIADVAGNSRSLAKERELRQEFQQLIQQSLQVNPQNQMRFQDELQRQGLPQALPSTGVPDAEQQLAISKALFWGTDRRTLSFLFTQTPPSTAIRNAIMEAIEQWQAHVPFKISQASSSAEITISFQANKGHWSYVGTSSARKRPSMNIQPNVPNENFRRVALHEFGHALGAIHEHQSPNAAIPWNVNAVLEFYRRTQGWDANMTRQQVLDKYSNSEQFNASTYDSRSIMQYPIPASLRTDGKSIEWNDTLSPTDIAFMRQVYGMSPLTPGGGEGTIEPKKEEQSRRARLRPEDAVALGMGDFKDGVIKDVGDVALYRFDISAEQEIVLETTESPARAFVIELYSGAPFEKNKSLAESVPLKGRSLLHAYLRTKLSSGRYYALVLPRVHSRTANFTIHLRDAANDPADSRKLRVEAVQKVQQEIKSIQEAFPSNRKK